MGQFGRATSRRQRLERHECRRAHSEPARRSTPWKNGLSTCLRRPAQLRELRSSHAASPFYLAARVSRRSQARLSERALRHVTRKANRSIDQVRAAGDMLRQRTMRAARRTRQTGKPFAGEYAGQVTDLHPTAQACAVGTPAWPGRIPSSRRRVFPRRRAVRRAACFPLPITTTAERENSGRRHETVVPRAFARPGLIS